MDISIGRPNIIAPVRHGRRNQVEARIRQLIRTSKDHHQYHGVASYHCHDVEGLLLFYISWNTNWTDREWVRYMGCRGAREVGRLVRPYEDVCVSIEALSQPEFVAQMWTHAAETVTRYCEYDQLLLV